MEEALFAALAALLVMGALGFLWRTPGLKRGEALPILLLLPLAAGLYLLVGTPSRAGWPGAGQEAGDASARTPPPPVLLDDYLTALRARLADPRLPPFLRAQAESEAAALEALLGTRLGLVGDGAMPSVPSAPSTAAPSQEPP